MNQCCNPASNDNALVVMIVGASGKMGQLVCETLRQDCQVKQVVPVVRGDCLQDMLQLWKPHVLIELTDVDSVFANTRLACEQGVSVIVGASGLTDDQLQQLDSLSLARQVSLLVVPNFSIAAVMMVKAARMASAWLSDCEIIEYHHAEKKDAPSATSLHTAEEICRSGAMSVNKRFAETVGYRHRSQVPIHSIRAPGFVAKQDVIFSQSGESLTLSLSQINREAFMPGVKLAVKRFRKLGYGLRIGLDAVLELVNNEQKTDDEQIGNAESNATVT